MTNHTNKNPAGQGGVIECLAVLAVQHKANKSHTGDYSMKTLVNAIANQSTAANIISLKKKHLKAVDYGLAVLSQAHTDLSELCEVVCSENRPSSLNACVDLDYIINNIASVSTKIQAYTTDSRFLLVYEECNLAESLLTCLIFTAWTQERPATHRQLNQREATVVFGVVFTAMARLSKALKVFKAVIV
ncbi:MAG: hypothetical protein ACEQSD_02030 [Flavobacteriales bacterium]